MEMLQKEKNMDCKFLHLSPNYILCGSSALEYMGYFAGYLSDPTIYVYTDHGTSIIPDPNIAVIPAHENLQVNSRNGIRYTTFDQTINDMLSNAELEDPQALMEALNEYLYQYGYTDPRITDQNTSKYLYYKERCADYYVN